MKIERTEKFIRVTPDEGKILFFDRGWSVKIFAPVTFDVAFVDEYDEYDLTREGSVWMAEHNYHYVKDETEENVGSMIILEAGDDIRNYHQEPNEMED